MGENKFFIADYCVFGATIFISLGIGVFYALSGGRQKTTSEYLIGGRTMKFLPVAISLLVSFESSIMMLALPAEGYIFGIQYFWTAAGFCIAQLMSVAIVVPLIHPLRITSAYEYLEYRFNSKAVRMVGTVLGMLTYLWYIGIVLFGPAVAVEAVAGVPQWYSIAVVAVVSVIYTAIGGIKAVIWTDVFQAVIMLAGVMSILVKGTLVVGGPAEVWSKAEAGGRLNFFNFDTDLRTRHTFWNLCVGSVIRGFGLIFNQSSVQRISSTSSVREAKRVLLVVAPAFFISLSLAVYEGIVAYAYFETEGCDPFKNKDIKNANQIIPFAVMQMFEGLPGLPGLFMASLFSASLSTLSSGLSSLSALLWADVLSPLMPNASEAKATVFAKVSVVIFGCAAAGVAVIVSFISGPLTQITSTLLSAFGGPLSGIFFLGCFAPRCTAKGAIIGALCGAIVTGWISLGMSFHPGVPKATRLPPASTNSCVVPDLNTTFDAVNLTTMYTTPASHKLSSEAFIINNFTDTVSVAFYNATTEMTSSSPDSEDGGLSGIALVYGISYTWLSIIGIFCTIIMGLVFSFLFGWNAPGDVDPRYLLPLTDVLLFWLPGPIKKSIKATGPQFIKEEYKNNFPDPALKHKKYNVEMELGNTDIDNLVDDIMKDTK